MSNSLAFKAASELNQVFDLPFSEQSLAYKTFKLKYRVVSQSCGMKMTLVDGSVLALDESSASWQVEVTEQP